MSMELARREMGHSWEQVLIGVTYNKLIQMVESQVKVGLINPIKTKNMKTFNPIFLVKKEERDPLIILM